MVVRASVKFAEQTNPGLKRENKLNDTLRWQETISSCELRSHSVYFYEFG